LEKAEHSTRNKLATVWDLNLFNISEHDVSNECIQILVYRATLRLHGASLRGEDPDCGLWRIRDEWKRLDQRVIDLAVKG